MPFGQFIAQLLRIFILLLGACYKIFVFPIQKLTANRTLHDFEKDSNTMNRCKLHQKLKKD